MEQRVVSGIAYAKDEAKITLLKIADKPGVAASIFGPLAEASINVDMIVQNLSADGKSTDMTFTVQESELPRALEVLKGVKKEIGAFEIKSSNDVAKVSVIGIGMRSHAGVAAQMFKALAEKGINILAISTSEIKISVLIDAAYAELAVRTLHSPVRARQRLILWLAGDSGRDRHRAAVVRPLRDPETLIRRGGGRRCRCRSKRSSQG